MTTLWAHTPNAVYIDRVLYSIARHPEYWHKHGQKGTWSSIWNLSWQTVRDLNRDNAANQAWQMTDIHGNDWSEECSLARIALIMLLAWDDCGYMIDSDPDELAVISKLGDPKASALLPACRALSKTVDRT